MDEKAHQQETEKAQDEATSSSCVEWGYLLAEQI
jgi:hypothetical protein